MIQNRNSFLNRIANRLGRKTYETRPVQREQDIFQPQYEIFKNFSKDELVGVLKEQCNNIHTDFYEVSIEDLSTTLYKVIKKYNGKRIITQTDKRHRQFQTDQLFSSLSKKAEYEIHYWHPEKGRKNQVFAEKADIGITFSDVTLSESATVALFNDAYHGRSISLLPQSYIAIIPKSTLVPRYTQLAEKLHELNKKENAIGSCVSLVTGPSNSADIEMKLIVGVHGPVEASYILINDA